MTVTFARFDDEDESGLLGWATSDREWIVAHTVGRRWQILRRTDPPTDDLRWYDVRAAGSHYLQHTEVPTLAEARDYIREHRDTPAPHHGLAFRTVLHNADGSRTDAVDLDSQFAVERFVAEAHLAVRATVDVHDDDAPDSTPLNQLTYSPVSGWADPS